LRDLGRSGVNGVMTTLPRGVGVVSAGLFTVALSACGQPAVDSAGSGRGGGGGSISASGLGGSGGVGVEGGAGTSAAGGPGASAGAGGSAPAEPPADISGRWGMFGFEDPVGVLLKEAADGTLTGEGCAAGAPGVADVTQSLLIACGEISGKVTGHTAWFGFAFVGPPGGYSAQVTVSSDGKRMAGNFENGDPNWRFLTAWLPVADDANWLTAAPLDENDPLAGHYDLTLLPEASTGGELTAGVTYSLGYFGQTLSGDLGSFWWSEISDRAQGSPLRAGPVPATQSGLPTSLTVDFDASGLTRAVARTPSGGLYTFVATKRP